MAEASWRLPASKADPRAVGVSRSHGCACGRCVFGEGDADLECLPSDLPAVALCPVRVAARHVERMEGFPTPLSPTCPRRRWLQPSTRPPLA